MASPIARKLRKSPTDAEIRLWSRLRRKQIEGFRFRRQQPIGRYIVDFFCPEAKLIIEVDGGQHAERQAEDAARTIGLRPMVTVSCDFGTTMCSRIPKVSCSQFSMRCEADPPPLSSPSRGEGDSLKPIPFCHAQAH